VGVQLFVVICVEQGHTKFYQEIVPVVLFFNNDIADPLIQIF